VRSVTDSARDPDHTGDATSHDVMVSRLVARLSQCQREEAVETEGVITALDRNFTILVNHRSISSTVEYRCCGRRVAQMNSDLINRAGWRVGALITVRYHVADPDHSVIMAERRVATARVARGGDMLLAAMFFMVAAVLLLSGVAWRVVTFFLFRRLGPGMTNPSSPDVGNLISIAFWSMRWVARSILVGLGLLFLRVGLRGVVRHLGNRRIAEELAQRGIPTEGVITFLDCNYSVLVNHRPISSIVEYRF
jgi:hypothetical protein